MLSHRKSPLPPHAVTLTAAAIRAYGDRLKTGTTAATKPVRHPPHDNRQRTMAERTPNITSPVLPYSP